MPPRSSVPVSRLAVLLGLAALGCADKSPSGADSADTASTGTDGDSGTPTGAVADCTDQTGTAAIVCATEALLATLPADQLAAVQFDMDDAVSKTRWSNLPVGQITRNGPTQGELSATSLVALDALAQALLSDDGYDDYVGILAADDYLGDNGGGAQYSSALATVAVFGTPSVSDAWMLQLGNHHMAYNVTFVDGVGLPTPSHQAAEPKEAFTWDGTEHAPVVGEGAAMAAVFAALDSSTRSAAQLSGRFADVLLGPVEYETGSLADVVFPTGDDRGGVVVSTLDADQQALVVAAITEWAGDFDGPAISDALLAEATSAEALADTRIAWAGTTDSPDLETEGTYFRIDGPRVWIELACQGGVIFRDATHFHTIFRDKSLDYGGVL